MGIEITDYLDVRVKLSELGCHPVKGLALLPSNFSSSAKIADFRQMSESGTVKTLFRNVGLSFEEIVDPDQRPPYIQNNFADWVGPTIFIATSLWSQNPLAVSVALNVISNYLTDMFKGFPKTTVKLDFVVEKTKAGKYTKIAYEGDVAGIAALESVLKNAVKD